MKIDKSNFKIGMWYTDENGNIVENEDYCLQPNGAKYYHTCYPTEIVKTTYAFYDKNKKCKHKHTERTYGWEKGLKGKRCLDCGRDKLGKKYKPWFMIPWNNGAYSHELFTEHTHIGNDDIVTAMVKSCDYSVGEAIYVYGKACERCMNVLAYKYLDGKEGYPEYSKEWEKAGTSCKFCK